jgi:nitrogen-specific signal transduction histidine kinase
MRRRLAAVFVLVVAAFAGLDLVVLLSLWPQLRQVEALGPQYAASSRLIAEMRGALRDERMAATQLYVELRAVGAPVLGFEAELAASRLAFDSAARQYDATPMVARETEIWRTLHEQVLPDLRGRIERLLGSEGSPGSPDQRALFAIASASRSADDLLEQLAVVNADELAASGEELHARVVGTIAVCVALGAVGLVGGLLLVRWALALVGDYERSTGERLRELDEFAGRVAHDLRNPLQAIGMSLALIEKRSADDRTRALCERAKGSVARLARFIDELLTFARSGARPEPDAAAEVGQVLAEVREDLAPKAAASEVELDVHDGGGVWARISPEALRAIVANLADNAVKHMGDAGPERRVELRAAAEGRQVRIVVRDTGPGIDRAALPRLFDPFYRGSERPGSFGIGLKTVKRLVDAHGGTIAVESGTARGATFVVTLPAAPPGPAGAAAARA